MGTAIAPKLPGISWADVKSELESEGSKNKVYDPGLLGTIPLSEVNVDKDLDLGAYNISLDGVIPVTETEAKGKVLKYNKESEELLASDDSEATMTSATYTKLKEFTNVVMNTVLETNLVTELRLHVEARGSVAADMKVRFYKNGVAYGIAHAIVSSAWLTKEEDLTFETGDTIELWGRSTGVSTLYVKNFRVKGVIEPGILTESISIT